MNITTNTAITDQLQDAIALRQHILNDQALLQKLNALAVDCQNAIQAGGKIILAGNGGSMADAQHLAAEFVGRFVKERIPLAAICLGTNISSTTAIGNDYGFDQIFSRELIALGDGKDVLIAITTSGNSKNILKLLESANIIGMNSYIWSGNDGGDLKDHQNAMIVPSTNTARIQEMHITFGHILCSLIDSAY